MKKIVVVMLLFLSLLNFSFAADGKTANTKSWDLHKYGGKGTLYCQGGQYYIIWDNGKKDHSIDQEFAKNWAAMMEMI